MQVTEDFFDYLQAKLESGRQTQQENLEKAADLIIRSIDAKGNFYVFGSGHSHMIAEELYTRAGGLDIVKAILPPELMLHQMHHKSTNLERLPGYAKAILDLYPVNKDDAFLIISNSGRNSVPVEMALEAKKRGANIIAMTSVKHSSKVPSRQVDGYKLYEVADVVIDNQADLGDAAFQIKGANAQVGGISDFMGIAFAQALVAIVVQKMLDQGKTPNIYKSANI